MHRLDVKTASRDQMIDLTARVQQIIGSTGASNGQVLVYVPHTTAGVTINENADPDVPRDLESSMNAIAPETFPYLHTCEGPDDMPAHVKASLLGASVTIPVHEGRLALGTWQGIYLCEHRNHSSGRRLMLTLQGETDEG